MMETTFQNSVAILEIAYLKGQLNPVACAGCACGNLLAGYNNFNLVYRPNQTPALSYAWVNENGEEILLDAHNYSFWRYINNYDIMDIMHNSGYTRQELRQIEKVFMHGENFKSLYKDIVNPTNEELFNGLMLAIDVLAEIHGVDLTTTKNTKEVFGKTNNILVSDFV